MQAAIAGMADGKSKIQQLKMTHQNHQYDERNCNYTDSADAFSSIFPCQDGEEGEGAILSEAEYQAYKVLSKITCQSILGAAIRLAVGKPDRRIFRELIKELYEQSIDAPKGLMAVIGEDGVSAVRRCFSDS